MAKGSLSVFELHVEKIVLGLSVAFAGGLLGYYAFMSPNRITIGSETVAPREVDQKVLAQAQLLDSAVRNAKPGTTEVPQMAKKLEEQLTSGVLGAGPNGGPPVAPTLRLATAFHEPLPKISDDGGSGGPTVALVSPMKPAKPAVRTGRSMAYVTDSKEPNATEGTKPRELPWISVASYYDVKGQQDAMLAAGYPPFLAKAVVVGMDVERQELLDSGEWSEWKTAPPSKATAAVDIPSPMIDDKTGDLRNRDVLEQALNQLRSQQTSIMQPRFYVVTKGDEWKVPPLHGYEDVDEFEVEDEPRPKPKDVDEPKPRPGPTRQPPGPPVGVGGGGGVKGGGGGGGLTVGGGGKGGGGGGGPPRPTPPNPGADKAEAQKQIKEDLKEARDAMKSKDWGRAQQLADNVKNNEHANNSQKKDAQEISESATRELEKVRAPLPGSGPYPPGVVGSGKGGGGAPGAPNVAPSGSGRDDALQIRDPQTGQPAIWHHDDSVENGKTYRYRMRVKLWNRYLGRIKSLKDPAGARQIVLDGEWSEPSEPVSVAPNAHFFVKAQRGKEPVASLDVFKWRNGEWLKQSFDVRVGDAIGGMRDVKGPEDDKGKPTKESFDFGAGATVLDLRFDETVRVRRPGKKGEFTYLESPSLVLVYVDQGDGQVKVRIAAADKYDVLYKHLKDETKDTD